MDRRAKAELLAEEQEKAINYLKSAPRRRIQEMGRSRRTPLLMSEDDTQRHEQKWKLKRNLIHPKSLPRLKEEIQGTKQGIERDLSLKTIIRTQLTNS